MITFFENLESGAVIWRRISMLNRISSTKTAMGFKCDGPTSPVMKNSLLKNRKLSAGQIRNLLDKECLAV
ncbi:MAG: hypothetical protein OXC91_00455 [Rhodobacteraceae bacterium]|nr:hypothetical protein [Paracoccaceae bacterium]